jgi:hypothetical protein
MRTLEFLTGDMPDLARDWFSCEQVELPIFLGGFDQLKNISDVLGMT